jgi:hypothetical protein
MSSQLLSVVQVRAKNGVDRVSEVICKRTLANLRLPLANLRLPLAVPVAKSSCLANEYQHAPKTAAQPHLP